MPSVLGLLLGLEIGDPSGRGPPTVISRCPSSRQQGRVPDHAAHQGQAPPPGHPVWAPHALGATRTEFHLPGPSSRAAPSVGLESAQGRQTPRGPPRAAVAGGAARCKKEEDRKGTGRHKNVWWKGTLRQGQALPLPSAPGPLACGSLHPAPRPAGQPRGTCTPRSLFLQTQVVEGSEKRFVFAEAFVVNWLPLTFERLSCGGLACPRGQEHHVAPSLLTHLS